MSLFSFSPFNGEKVSEGRMRGGAAFEDKRAGPLK